MIYCTSILQSLMKCPEPPQKLHRPLLGGLGWNSELVPEDVDCAGTRALTRVCAKVSSMLVTSSALTNLEESEVSEEVCGEVKRVWNAEGPVPCNTNLTAS